MAEDLNQIEEAFASGKSFALAALPFSAENIVFLENEKGELQASDGSMWFTRAFDSKDKTPSETSFEEYYAVLSEAIDLLKSKELGKVVLSKVKKARIESLFSPSKLFQILKKKYPSAFKFIYQLNNGNVWFGATPEVLLDKDGSLFKTTALAGTRLKLGKNVTWGQKEIMEQQVVLDFLIKAIHTDPQAKIRIHATETVEAAHLEHIRTNVEYDSTLSLTHWIEKLHPTPAVCGIPKEQAYSFIVQNELHSRKQYAGVVGITNAQNAKLFVQLRCAEFNRKTNDFWIYTGGGIMQDSDINSEWQEAENKANVMLDVLSELASQRV